MQYEDIVYNAGILAMAVRLEEFLEEWARSSEGQKAIRKAEKSGKYSNVKYDHLSRFFEARGKGAKKGVQNCMERLFRKRDEIAHKRVNIGKEGFGEIRRGCVKADDWLASVEPPLDVRLPRMGEVMISCSLRYDMGNAGDIIKHGILAEFAKWTNGELRYADPFGGRPWGRPKPMVRDRFNRFKDSNCALWEAQKGSVCVSGGLYYGSSHVVRNIAQERAIIFADDIDNLARDDLKSSGLRILSDEFPGYKGNGYSILNPEILEAGRFNLILLDPHADFLRDELSVRSEEGGYFRKIKDAIEHNSDLWISVFVLVEGDDHRVQYEDRRNRFFQGRGIALGCSRMPVQERQPDGESRYDVETLLVSSRLAENTPRINELRERISNFKAGAEKALGGKEILIWERR